MPTQPRVAFLCPPAALPSRSSPLPSHLSPRLRPTAPPSRRPPARRLRAPPPAARIEPSDEGFVSCSACGSDVVVSLRAFASRDEAPVTCDNCGHRWRAGRAAVFTLDGAANIVAAADAAGAARDAFGQATGLVKLYVGGIGHKVTKEDLEEAFGEYGEVAEAAVVFDRVTGRSRGFAFVSMRGEGAAEAAMSEMHQSNRLGGRRMSVRLAEKR